MVSQAPYSDDVNLVGEKPPTRSSHDKKNTSKVPKKIHKAEREKQKRDSLNELYFELGNSLESAQRNNGKASIISETTRLLRDLLGQINSLRKENDALLYETKYVTVEMNEIKEENSALEAKIDKLQSVLDESNRSVISSTWNIDDNVTAKQPDDPDGSSQQLPVLGPVYMVPLHQDLQAYTEFVPTEIKSKLPTHVRRPHARYPSPSDEWPSQILSTKSKSVTSSSS